MRRTISTTVILIIAITILLNSCVSTHGFPAYDPNQHYEISIGLFSRMDEAFDAVFATDDFRTQFPNVTITIQTIDYGRHHQRLLAALDAEEATNDIEELSVDYISRFVETGGLTNLAAKPFNGIREGADLVDFAMSNATTRDGRLLAMPIAIAPAVMFYRESLLEAAGVDPQRIINAQSWDDILDIAEDLRDADQIAFTDAWDLAPFLLNGGLSDWFVDEQPLEPKEKFINALEVVSAIRKAGVDADYDYGPGPWWDSFENGDIALMVQSNEFGRILQIMLAEEVNDWRITYLPGQFPAAENGRYLSIPETVPDEKKVIAWEIIKYLTTNKNAQLTMFETIDAFPALTTTYDDPIMSEPVEYFGGAPVREIFADVALSMPAATVTEFDETARYFWSIAVINVINGEMGIEEAYETARESILDAIK